MCLSFFLFFFMPCSSLHGYPFAKESKKKIKKESDFIFSFYKPRLVAFCAQRKWAYRVCGLWSLLYY